MTGAASSPRADSGSFRDPADRVYLAGERVLRTVMLSMAEEFELVRSTDLVDRLVESGRLIPECRVAPGELGEQADIVKTESVSASGRRLFWFSRRERRWRPS